MEPSSPSPRASLLQRRLVAVAAVALLLVLLLGATVGVFLLAPSSSSTASASLVAAGASATDTSSPTASLESASLSSSESLAATDSPTLEPSATPSHMPAAPTATPSPTQIVLHGTFSFDAKTKWPHTDIAVRNGDYLEMWATGTYKVGSSDPGRTPASVGCSILATPNVGFAAGYLTKFAVAYTIESGDFLLGPNCLGSHATLGPDQVSGSYYGGVRVTVNDDYFNDNSGTITITWEVRRHP